MTDGNDSRYWAAALGLPRSICCAWRPLTTSLRSVPPSVVTDLFASGASSSADLLLARLRQATAGAYDIDGELGRGGMAVDYGGTDRKLERRVALKVMDPRLSMTQGMAARFLQEARIAARLQHPNIIVVHDVTQSDDIIFFVMSLIDGVAVDELCRQPEPIPIEQARWILLQASRALAYAHSEGIVHRDIKPANILVNLKGEIILTDFGIAKALGAEGLTRSGTQIGTPMYMSPEQFSNEPVGPASDQYALGITAYQLIAGRPPFLGDLYQLIASHGGRQPTPLRELRPDCPPFLANAIMRMLEKSVAARWPSLDDVQDVFGANMPVDGGAPRKKLAETVRALRKARVGSDVPTPNFTPATPIDTASPDSYLISISPPGATIFVGGSLDLRATVALDTGQSLPGAVVVWSTSDASVLSVQPNGALVGLAPGTAVVRATMHGTFTESTIRVDAAPIARLSLTTPGVTMRVGDVIRPAVQALDVNGGVRTDVALNWISRTPGVADLDAAGTIRAIAPGLAVIEVSVGPVRRSIDVTVLRRPVAMIRLRASSSSMELGSASHLRVDAFDDHGTVIESPPVRWTSSAPTIIHVDSAGTALAIGAGVARISAAVDEATDSIELQALEAPIGTITLALASSVITVGDEVAIVLRVKATDGSARSAAGIRVWSSTPEIAEVNAEQMVVRARTIGVARIHAAPIETEVATIAPTVDEMSSQPGAAAAEVVTTLEVRTAVATRLEVFPISLDLELGAVASVNVRGVDDRGHTVPQLGTSWESSAPETVSVDPAGVVRAVAPGTGFLRVTHRPADDYSGDRPLEASVAFRVRRASVGRLSISADRSMLAVGDALPLRVSVWDANGQEIDDAVPIWRSTDSAIARVEGSGRLLALATGRATIIAELGDKSAQFAVLIAPAPIERLAIGLDRMTAVVGDSLRVEVDAVDRNAQQVVPRLRWSVEPAESASVTSDGVIFVLLPGVITVRATIAPPADDVGLTGASAALSATVSFESREARAVSLRFSEPAPMLTVGTVRRLAVEAFAPGQRALPITDVAFVSENESIVRVRTDGAVEAVGAGSTLVEAQLDGVRASTSVRVRAVVASAPGRQRLAVGAGVVVIAAVSVVIATWGSMSPKGGGSPPDAVSISATPQASTSQSSVAPVAAGPTPSVPAPAAAAPTGQASKTPQAAAKSVGGNGIDSAVANGAGRRTAVVQPETRPARQAAAAPASSQSARNASPGIAATPGGGAGASSNTRTTPSAPGLSSSPAPATSIGSIPPATAAAAPASPVAGNPGAGSPPGAAPASNAAARTGGDNANAPSSGSSAESPTSADLKSAAERIAAEMKSGARRPTSDLKSFFGDGDAHAVALISTPLKLSDEGGRVRAQFDVRLSRFNSGGLPENLVTTVTAEVLRRNGVAEVQSVSFSPLVKSKSR